MKEKLAAGAISKKGLCACPDNIGNFFLGRHAKKATYV